MGVFGNGTGYYEFSAGDIHAVGDIYISGVKVVGARVVDARLSATPNSGDATTDGLIDALRDLVLSHGLGASS